MGKQQRAFLDELYEVQRALNEKHAPPKEGIQERDKLQSKLDGFYVVHSASPTEVVTIVDVKGDRYVVNMQRLNFFPGARHRPHSLCRCLHHGG